MIKEYWGSNEELRAENIAARRFTQKYNAIDPGDSDKLRESLEGFLGDLGEGSKIMQPFCCDRGTRIHIGKKTFINYNATLLDMTDIYIGDDVRIAPNVAIYTVWHPLDVERRQNRLCYTDEVYIGDHSWICGNVVILPGVHIGKGCVIGAGSVVTHDIEDNCLAYGNPCKVIRKLENKNE